MEKIVFFFLFSLFSHHVQSQQKTILCLIYTPSHESLYKEWLLPSIQDDFELIIGTAQQDCKEAKFYAKNWVLTMKKKVEHIIKTIKNNMGRLLIFADVDIQFFGPIENDIKRLIRNNDILFQRDAPDGRVCAGFFALKCNKKTLQLWQKVLEGMLKNPSLCDQKILAATLKKDNLALKWDYLPDRYFGGGSLTGRRWDPGNLLPIPDDILMHHANWCIGIPNKVKQLLYVKESVLNNQRPMEY